VEAEREREREGGGATVENDGVGATRVYVADRWAETLRGPGRQRLGVARGSAALTRGVDSIVRPIRFSNRIKFISNGFKFAPNFDRSKRCLPVLQKFQIKYG
jgi:hypothetical protein